MATSSPLHSATAAAVEVTTTATANVTAHTAAWLYNAWRISVATTCVMTTVTASACVSFSVYAWRQYRQKMKRNAAAAATNSAKHQYTRTILLLTVLIPLLTTVRFLATQAITVVGHAKAIEGDYCNLVMQVR